MCLRAERARLPPRRPARAPAASPTPTRGWGSRRPTSPATAAPTSSSRTPARQLHAIFRADDDDRARPGVRRRATRLRPGAGHAAHRLGRLVGRSRSRRQARARHRERRDPRAQPPPRRATDPGHRGRATTRTRTSTSAAAYGLRPGPARQRPRSGAGRLRQRRRPRYRGQLDRRQARPAARRTEPHGHWLGVAPKPLEAGNGRDVRARERPARSSARFSSGAATSRPKTLGSSLGSATQRRSRRSPFASRAVSSARSTDVDADSVVTVEK